MARHAEGNGPCIGAQALALTLKYLSRSDRPQAVANVGPLLADCVNFANPCEYPLWAHCCRPDAVRDRPHPLQTCRPTRYEASGWFCCSRRRVQANAPANSLPLGFGATDLLTDDFGT